jgi:putative ABC transport system substrate-binding protein
MRRREFIAGLGSAAGWPLLVRAQPQAKPTIAWLNPYPEPPREAAAFVERQREAFRRGLAEVGFSLGRDVTEEFYNTYGHPERTPALLADLVRRRPAAIIAPASGTALAFKAATRDIPIIFATGSDPVELGLVESLNHPGGNLTGVAPPHAELAEKRLDLLHQAVPTAETIALLVGTDAVFSAVETRHVQSAARSLGLRLLVIQITADTEIAPVFATLVEHRAGAVQVSGSVVVGAKNNQILSHAARFALPTMFSSSVGVRAGGLLSYSPDFIEISRQIGVYAGRILKGEKPADLPVLQPTKFEFVINLKTAKALGLTIPPTLVAIADEVIE